MKREKKALEEAKELEEKLNEIKDHIDVIKKACPYFAAIEEDKTLGAKEVLIDCGAKEYQQLLEPYRKIFAGENEEKGVHTWRFHLGKVYEIGEGIAEKYFSIIEPKYQNFLSPFEASVLRTPLACTGDCAEFVKSIRELEKAVNSALDRIREYKARTI